MAYTEHTSLTSSAADEMDKLLQRRGAVRHRLAQSGQQAAGSRPCRLCGAIARDQRRDSLRDQFGDDLRRRLLCRHHADRLAGHDRAILDIAIDHRAPQRAGPEMLDCKLGRLPGQLAGLKAIAGLRLEAQEALDPSLTSPRTGITGKRSSSCIDGSASRAAARMKAA